MTQNVIKTDKYQELKRMWKITDVKFLPLVISVEGTMSKRFKVFLKQATMPTGLYVLQT